MTAANVTTKMSASVASATVAAAETLAAGAPKSVLSIPSIVRHGTVPLSDLADETGRTPGAAISQLGSTRRIFFLNQQGHLKHDEMEGLAYRIKMLSRNSNLSSILLSNDADHNCDENVMLPTSVLEMELELESSGIDDDLVSFKSRGSLNAFRGYDPIKLQELKEPIQHKTLNAMTALALAIKGSNEKTEYASKIPFISVPDGLVSDGGYALTMGSYVLATSDSSFRIMNPLRGLSFDPIGLSYILPRLGWEYRQPCASFPVGQILALTGFEADGSDMVETGLATHMIESVDKLGTLERALSNLVPFEQQKIIKEPIQRYTGGVKRAQVDVNARFRNVAVAQMLFSLSSYDAMGQEFVSPSDEHFLFEDEDPSLVLEADKTRLFGDRSSMLLNIASTFQDVFEEEKSVEGIMERMREYASAEAKNEEEVEFVDAAKDLLDGMESQSPLALTAVHKLMMIGKGPKETLRSCMQREKKVQMKLLKKEDFNNWAQSGVKEGEFKNWKHKSVKDVTKDEIEELLK